MAGIVKSMKMHKKLVSFWRFFIFISFLSIISAGCSQPYWNDRYFSTLPPEQQKVELKKYLDVKFEDPQKLFMLGQLYHRDKQWDNAEFYYTNSLRFDPFYRPAQAAMIKLALDRGDQAEAQKYFDMYINQAGKSTDKLIELALEFQQQNLDTYALSCYQKALEIDPNSAKTYKYLGYYYLYKDDKAKAKEAFEKSFNIDRVQPDVALELGRLEVPIVYPTQANTTE